MSPFVKARRSPTIRVDANNASDRFHRAPLHRLHGIGQMSGAERNAVAKAAPRRVDDK
jgi:hypothetical protein